MAGFEGYETPSILLLFAPIAGLTLLQYSRKDENKSQCGAFGLFLLLVIPISLINLSLFVLDIPGLEFISASVTLSYIAWHFVTKKIKRISDQSIQFLFRLNVSLAIISVTLNISEISKNLDSKLTIIQGLLLLIAQLWDLLMSGGQVTNFSSKNFPRFVRIFLYSGFVIFVSILVLFFSFWRTTTTLGSLFDPDTWGKVGIITIGIGYLITSLILHQTILIKNENISETPENENQELQQQLKQKDSLSYDLEVNS